MTKFTLLFAFLFSFGAWAMPAQVILIRHGEEPKGKEGNVLSQKGWQRAFALPQIFETYPDLDRPVALFAAKPKDKHGSVRSIQTLTPLSQKLQLPIQIIWESDEWKMMVQQIQKDPAFDGRTVMICWSHDQIKDIAEEFGASHLKDWDGDKYSRIWLLTFDKGQFQKFEDRPQKLFD